MLLLLEEKIPGYVREKILIALYRLNGEGGFLSFDEVCKICRNTGYIPGPERKKPKNHPEAMFARFPLNAELVRLVIGRLQTDDVYLMSNSYPNPDHRSTRLATQASFLFVILYFAPEILHRQKSTMREIVDKYFNDNWVVATYMGQLYDLTTEWSSYTAARAAIENVITLTLIQQLNERNSHEFTRCLSELQVHPYSA